MVLLAQTAVGSQIIDSWRKGNPLPDLAFTYFPALINDPLGKSEETVKSIQDGMVKLALNPAEMLASTSTNALQAYQTLQMGTGGALVMGASAAGLSAAQTQSGLELANPTLYASRVAFSLATDPGKFFSNPWNVVPGGKLLEDAVPIVGEVARNAGGVTKAAVGAMQGLGEEGVSQLSNLTVSAATTVGNAIADTAVQGASKVGGFFQDAGSSVADFFGL